VIAAHGADAFRWYYFTSQQPWAGYRFSVETVGESVRQFLLTLWNTYSFWALYANAEGLGPADFGAEPAAESDLDRWALSRLNRTIEAVREQMDEFDCTTAGRAIAGYVEELSNWYVRLSRRRFWEGDRAAFATLRHCLLEVAALLAPFTPFLADEIHLNLLGGAAEELGEAPDSVHLRDFPEARTDLLDDELEAAMEAVRRTVELGRAARAQAKVKVRQPLRRAVVVATDAERDAILTRSDLVQAELNVKQLEFVAEESDLVSYRVKPDYRALGPRFGKQMPQVAAAVEALDAGHVSAAIDEGRDFGVNFDGHEHRIRPEEVSLVMEPLEGYQVEAEAGHAVALSLELDEELRREGLAREIVHAVQQARKAAGLEVTDRIELSLDGDEELLQAARDHEAYISGEVLAAVVVYGGVESGEGAHGELATIDGRGLRISLSRA
jgi:isoleucyl-tRNA synthetase